MNDEKIFVSNDNDNKDNKIVKYKENIIDRRSLSKRWIVVILSCISTVKKIKIF